MPDLGPLVAPVFQAIAPVAGHALKAFAKTSFGMVVYAVLLTAGAIVIAADGSVTRSALAALLALAVGTALGVLVASKRALLGAAVYGVRSLGLGSRLIDLVFGQLLRIDEFQAVGQRGVAVARTVERLPLAEAERRLRAAVESLIAARPEGKGVRAWFARKIQERLLRKIEELTLARFREQGAASGGVDLVLVRNELAPKIDTLLTQPLEAAMLKITVLALVGAAIVSLGGAYGIRQIAI